MHACRRDTPGSPFAVWLLAGTAGFGYREIGQTLVMTTAHMAVTLDRLRRMAPGCPVQAWIRQQEERISTLPDGGTYYHMSWFDSRWFSYPAHEGATGTGRASELYMDIINLFLRILRIMGRRK